MSKKALLMILDGWGIGDQGKDDVIFNTPTPYWDSLLATYPHSQLQASGENVGLPDGQMGNSEVGHLNIGAGRIVYQDLVKINIACRENTIMENPDFVAIAKAYGIAGRTVEKREELDEAIAEMLNHNGAFVLVANVETCGMVYPMVPAGGSVTNMILGDK